jgi:quercetin dioxygenase-like cupin family protein
MPNELDRLLRLMTNNLCQSELPICQVVAAAVEESVGQIPKKSGPKSESIPFKLDDIDPPLFDTQMDLCQVIFRSSADLSWRRPGFGKIPDDIASHMAVCEIIGPTGQIKHEMVRAGLLFQASGITYPRHSHAAEEIYFPLTGPVEWQIQNNNWRQKEAGSLIHHLPYQPHAIRTSKTPLLTIWGWSGDIDPNSYRI